MGGCLLGSDMLKWATSMRAYNALPPDPSFRDDWREVWLERLGSTPAFIESWLTPPDARRVLASGLGCRGLLGDQAATLLVGGWADAYTNAVPRLLEHLECERRGLIGPWAHFLPYLGGEPGPRIGFLQECLRWFDRWLKGIDTGVEADPLLRVWVQESVAPAASYHERPGRWVGSRRLAAARREPRVVAACGARRTDACRGGRRRAVDRAMIVSPQHVGRELGRVVCERARRRARD